MNWNKLVRQTHRWLSMIFVGFVLVNIVVNVALPGQTDLSITLGLSTLLPLFLLMISGIYLFVLPYVAGRRTARPQA